MPQAQIDDAQSIAERFLLRWRGEADPRHVKAIDAYWVSAAEHGMNASTFTARVVASTGADCAAALSAAVGALSGPLHGGAPSRVLKMLDEVEALGDAERWVRQSLDRSERLMGFGHRVYRAEDPRARVLRRCARELGAPRLAVAEALEQAALAELHARKPDRVLATNVEFWSAVLLDFAQVPAELFTPMFTCARTAGWSAHILEQKREGRLIRPSAKYVGEPPRSRDAVEPRGGRPVRALRNGLGTGGWLDSARSSAMPSTSQAAPDRMAATGRRWRLASPAIGRGARRGRAALWSRYSSCSRVSATSSPPPRRISRTPRRAGCSCWRSRPSGSSWRDANRATRWAGC